MTILSKIFEKSAANQLLKYFEDHLLINNKQHAYRKCHSTITCLFELINYIHEKLDQRKVVAIVSLDLSKAFDTINHDLLLKKLGNLNLNKQAIEYISSYLKNRLQVTKMANFNSIENEIISGVPQGSILGPLLFLCFINDLPKCFDNVCKFLSYADDTQLVVTAENDEELTPKIENVINLAQCWYEKNGMKNNSGKSEVLVISHRTKIPLEIKTNTLKDKNKSKITKSKDPKFKNLSIIHPLKINVKENKKSVQIFPKKSIKVLGIDIDEKLTWVKQANKVKRNAINVIRKVHRINKFLPLKLKMTLYQTLISPLFNYADIIWGGCNKKTQQKVQVAQNFAVRSILGRQKHESAKAALKELGLLNLENRRVVHAAVFAHKSLSNKTTQSINQKYQEFRPKTNTRNSINYKINIPRHNMSKYKRSPFYRTIKAWNQATPFLGFGEIKGHKNSFQAALVEECCS